MLEETKMKFSKLHKIILLLIVLIIILIFTRNHLTKLSRNERYKHSYIGSTIEKIENGELQFKHLTDTRIEDVAIMLFYDKSIWDKLPLSNHFVEKFKTPSGIIKKYNKYDTIDVGLSNNYTKNNIVDVMCTERDSILSSITGKNITTVYTFEYIIDGNGMLDDLILLKEEDIDSMTSETYAERTYSQAES